MFLAMVCKGWDSFEPSKDSYLPIRVNIDARPSTGFAPIYDSLEDLLRDNPGAAWMEIQGKVRDETAQEVSP